MASRERRKLFCLFGSVGGAGALGFTWRGVHLWTGGGRSHLQPLVEGLSCSELSRLKALELLGGDGLWESELWEEGTEG